MISWSLPYGEHAIHGEAHAVGLTARGRKIDNTPKSGMVGRKQRARSKP